jgi:ribosomal subunit interface protein
MEIVVTGRHVEVKDRFRRHLQDKLAKVPQLAPRIQRLDVVISHEPNRRQSPVCERVEITVVGKGPVVRAEAAAEDPYVALDRAYAKLLERLRRAHDRKVVHRGRHAPESVAQATARAAGLDGTALDGAAFSNAALDGAALDGAGLDGSAPTAGLDGAAQNGVADGSERRRGRQQPRSFPPQGAPRGAHDPRPGPVRDGAGRP